MSDVRGRGGCRSGRWTPLALALALALAGAGLGAAGRAQGAYFERMEVGARGLALAEAYEAGVEDVSAAYWNPAALSLLSRTELLLTHSRPYVVEGLAANAVVGGLPLPFMDGGVALWWHRLGVADVVTENLFGLSFGRWVYRDNARVLHLGATAKVTQVAFDAAAGVRDFGTETRVTADVAALLQEGSRWRFGAVWRNVGEPDFSFVEGGDGASLPGGLALSTSVQWRPESTLYFSRTDLGGDVSWNYAGEIWFYQVFAIRAGIYHEEFSGGFGVRGRGWQVDGAFQTEKSLGNTYRASILFYLPEKETGKP